MPTVVVIHGPNLNRLGKREPEIYGTTTLAGVEKLVRAHGREIGWKVETFQSNHEGALIDRVHAAADAGADGIILNGGALTHYSYALADALRSVEIPTVEVHISDIHKRESWRRRSVTGDACIAVLAGLGVEGYSTALDLLAERVAGASKRRRADAAKRPPKGKVAK
ncbi:MAG TPA: type II 3-dehydroquinate dehydratase [Candidatus Dormibacteraeota bacterium]|jgi:3-dehydroquinate dehydratase-2|nr:type II 3-dehydroquinate dehydratase [Candidatus Dormibacteraeota bacterium]